MSKLNIFIVCFIVFQNSGFIYADEISIKNKVANIKDNVINDKMADEVQIIQKFSPEKLKDMKGKETFKADHKRNFREGIIKILSIAFNTQDSQNNSRNAMKIAMEKFEKLKQNRDLRPHYIMACNALISFLENLSEPDVYKKYIQMIDTPDEIYNIADAFTWLATSMEKLVKYGYSDETMRHITNRNFIFRHIYSLSNINIFSNLYFEQRQFLLKMFDWCEQILSFSLIGNGPGYEDGIDWWVNDTAIFFDKARTFDNEMNKIFDQINASFSKKQISDIVSVKKAIENLDNFMKNAYLNKINVRNEEINPTKTMIFEICQKAKMGQNIAKYYLKVLESNEKNKIESSK